MSQKTFFSTILQHLNKNTAKKSSHKNTTPSNTHMTTQCTNVTHHQNFTDLSHGAIKKRALARFSFKKNHPQETPPTPHFAKKKPKYFFATGSSRTTNLGAEEMQGGMLLREAFAALIE